MKHTWKKAAAGLLALALVAGAAPANVGTGGLFGGAAIVANAATTVTTFEELSDAVGMGGLVTLGADIVEDDGYIYVYDDATLDLNGHTLSVGEENIAVSGSAFTIKDSVGNGKYVSAYDLDILIYSDASFTLESGTLEFTSSNAKGVDVYGGTFIMNGGTINSAGNSIWRDGGSVTINGGTINGDFYEENGSMTINGGIFDFDVTSYVAAETEVEQVGDFWGVGAKSIAELKGTSITETLLTTITATGKTTFSQSEEGVVTVTLTNIEYYRGEYGWLWNGTITVEPVEGYTITRCRFIQNAKTPLDDDLAPFSIVMNDAAAYPCSVITSAGQKGGGMMDGVTSIEVYGYATPAPRPTSPPPP